MKAIFVAYNQAYNDEIVELLSELGHRGFTRWDDIKGRGMVDGEPHFGSHAWPEMNHAVLVMVEDEKVSKLLSELKAKDEASPDLGLRAFVWNIENFY
mgnify:CR=1 FL=1